MGLLQRIALGAAGTLLGIATIAPKTLDDYVLAQDAKPMADTSKEDHKIALNNYQKFSTDFYAIGNDFYKKAKDKDKALEALGIAAYFDSTNKNVSDLIQTVEKSKLKKNDKEAKKVEETYGKTKQEAIDTLYKSAVEKLPTDKTGAFKDFDGIWKVDDKSVKPYEALGFVKNDGGFYESKERHDRREAAKKIFESAGEGEINNKKDDLESIMNIKPFRRSGNQIIARSTVSDERAKQMHKAADATFAYMKNTLGIEGNPFEGTDYMEDFKEDIKKDGGKIVYRVTEFNKTEDFDKYCEAIADKKGCDSSWGSLSEKWRSWTATSDKDSHNVQPGTFHYFQEISDDVVIHYLTGQISVQNNNLSWPWLTKGLAYDTTAQLAGTTLTRMVYMKDDKYEGWKEHEVKVATPDGIQSLVYELVSTGKEIPLEELARKKIRDMTPKDVAMSASLFEFLITKYQTETRRLLTDKRTGNADDFTDLKYDEMPQKIYGKSWKDLHAEWRQYVLEENIGYRKPQN